MLQDLGTNNKVEVAGTVTSEMTFNHEVYGESFFSFMLKVPRLSDVSDYIMVTASERLLMGQEYKIGSLLYITGQYRSYNNFAPEGNKLILTVFAKDILPLTELSEKSVNNIYLNGFVCKEPVYRTTPLNREIADILLAVNRTYKKSDYIPCIAWGRNARYVGKLNVGDNLVIWGRVQSRDYQKKGDDESITLKTAYEVSISKLELGKIIIPSYEEGMEYN